MGEGTSVYSAGRGESPAQPGQFAVAVPIRSHLMDPAYTIRPATPDDVPLLAGIEVAASRRFRDVGLSLAADLPPLPEPLVRRAQEEERAWVATDGAGTPVGFLVASVRDRAAYVDEVDVLPEHGRRGIARALLEAVAAWARSRGLEAVTLSTFRHVPWNAPFYLRAGFRELRDEELTPALAEVRECEAGVWISVAAERVILRRDLGPGHGT